MNSKWFMAGIIGALIATPHIALASQKAVGYPSVTGANATVFSYDDASRPGEFSFVYGGAASTGQVRFFHYDGSTFSEKARLDANGVFRIGTGTYQLNTRDCNGCKLAVIGKIQAEELELKLSTQWPDYVFQKDYQLTPLPELEAFINENGHLPDVPSAQTVANEGIALGAMNTTMMRKLEELTLYVIQLNNENQKLRREMDELRSR